MHAYCLGLSILLGLCGCEGETAESSVDLDASYQVDGGQFDGEIAPDFASPDAQADAARPICAELLRADTDLPIAPDDTQTQIHADAAADGNGVWVVFNQANSDRPKFDVWATRIGCDGSTTVAPFLVNTDAEQNDTDPVIAISGNQVLIAWQTDTEGADPNLTVRYRLFERDGTPLGNERILATTFEGEPILSNAWMPAVAPLAEGGFAIAGARGTPAANGFQVFVQRIDEHGDPQGATVGDTSRSSQLEPDIALAHDGTLYLSWIEQGRWVKHTRLRPTGNTFDPNPAEIALEGRQLVASVTAGDDLWVAASINLRGAVQVHLRRANPFGFESEIIQLGMRGRIDHTPTVVEGLGGGVVGWYRRLRGSFNAIFIQKFSGEGRLTVVDDPIEIPLVNDEFAAPYALALEPIDIPGIYFAIWSQGANPDYQLHARFLDLR